MNRPQGTFPADPTVPFICLTSQPGSKPAWRAQGDGDRNAPGALSPAGRAPEAGAARDAQQQASRLRALPESPRQSPLPAPRSAGPSQSGAGEGES